MDTKKEKSKVIIRTVVSQNGQERTIEESLDDIQSETSLVSDQELNELFDSIFPEDDVN